MPMPGSLIRGGRGALAFPALIIVSSSTSILPRRALPAFAAQRYGVRGPGMGRGRQPPILLEDEVRRAGTARGLADEGRGTVAGLAAGGACPAANDVSGGGHLVEPFPGLAKPSVDAIRDVPHRELGTVPALVEDTVGGGHVDLVGGEPLGGAAAIEGVEALSDVGGGLERQRGGVLIRGHGALVLVVGVPAAEEGGAAAIEGVEALGDVGGGGGGQRGGVLTLGHGALVRVVGRPVPGGGRAHAPNVRRARRGA
mmetsp:Transcript_57851/g.183453  ORF Transcript_57851/g.183453 Transcript_57851/m.183453 type:complete len:255 (-) Transcript_57851:703-1467(-)